MPDKPTYEELLDQIEELRQFESEYKKKQNSILFSRGYLEKLNNSLSEAIFTVKMPERLIEYANSSVDKIFGYSPEECVGKSTEFLYQNKEAYSQFGEKLKYTIDENKDSLNTEQTLVTKDGKTFPSETTITFIREEGQITHVISIVRDISERKEAEEALRESERRFRNLAENIEEVFWIGSPDWQKVFYISPAFEKVWGRPCKELLDNPLSWLEAVVEEDRKSVEAYIQEKSKGNFDEIIFPEYRILRPDGEQRWIFARGFPIRNEKNEICRIAGIAEDITLRKRTEMELLDEKEKLEEAIAEIKKLSGFLPICASCKKIRDDKGYWRQIESYIQEHSEAEFSHGICPDCIKKLYSDLDTE